MMPVNKGQDMSSAVFKQICTQILENTKSKTIQFILHGGEPSLLSTDWFNANLSFLDNLAKKK